ncbi:nucleotidyltransferase family protein [Methylomonas methanica]|uniref:DNA polymerase beta n=1 Tax=Methylomonas methanica TaxID=421 RepID=A0A177MMR9_METMH|nr:nucleotidyltransferase domain-containing protein [Methylomonas methanica]OAI07088.1 DNA polymerase beta [Methylomonas methanica]
MRLSKEQTQLIAETILGIAGTDVAVYLFGSRLNDQAKGGDVDLFIESDQPISLLRRAQIKMQLESQLGLPVDIICQARVTKASPFRQIAKGSAVKLSA